MTYTYCCKECECEFEVDKKITDDSKTQCVSCASFDTQRLITNGNFVLTGSGWAKDNYSK